MIKLNGMDHATNTAIFSLSKASDIADLPTTTVSGSNGTETFMPVKAGSFAFLTDGSGEKYVLDADTDEWRKTV